MKTDAGELPIDALPFVIAGIDPGELVDTLRYNDALAEEVVRGFRLNRTTIRMPIVRQRLAKAAQRDMQMAKMLLEMWQWSADADLKTTIENLAANDLTAVVHDLAKRFGGEQVWVALLMDGRKGVRKLADKHKEQLLITPKVQAQPADTPPQEPAMPAPKPAVDSTKEKRLREELTAAREQNRRLTAQSAEAAKSADKEKRLAADLSRELTETRRTIDRLQRKLEREQEARSQAEAEAAGLRRSGKKPDKSSASSARPGAEQQPKTETWAETVTRLINNRSYDAAIAFCEQYIGLSPEDAQGHALLARAFEESKLKDPAVKEHLWLADHLLSAGKTSDSARHVFAAIALNADSPSSLRRLQSLLCKLDVRNAAEAEALRKELQKLRVKKPQAYERISEAIAKAGSDLNRALSPAAPAVKPGGSLPMPSGAASPAAIISAIDRNDELFVASARESLDGLKSSNAAARKSFLDNLRVLDPTCVTALTVRTRPIVVDGSNVAFALQTELGKPRLNNILLARKTLRAKGYFPVIIYADANLPYRIDQRGSIEKLIKTEELLLVDSHTDADETIIREAKRRSCPILTNDRMLDLDPQIEVEKIRFDLDQNTLEFI